MFKHFYSRLIGNLCFFFTIYIYFNSILTLTFSCVSKSKTTVRSVSSIHHLLPLVPQLQLFICVYIFAGGPLTSGGLHPHVICLTSSPLSPKHFCCAAFKSAGYVMKVCIHSFSLLQFICVLLLRL